MAGIRAGVFKYYYIGFYQESFTWDDIKPYRIGNGIDIGRDTLGFRLEASWKERLDNLFDLRNVHPILIMIFLRPA
ncbi:MAG: hypothetical protein ABIH40_02690 [Candidatus Omnitrophota bacterium]